MKKGGFYILIACIGFCLWAVLFLAFINAFDYFVFGTSSSSSHTQMFDPPADHFLGLTRDVITMPYYFPGLVMDSLGSSDRYDNTIVGLVFISVLFFLMGPYFWTPVFMILVFVLKQILLKKRP